MGMFDSLYIELDGQELEVQTKRFDCGLGSYRVGDWIDGAPPGIRVYFDNLSLSTPPCPELTFDAEAARDYRRDHKTTFPRAKEKRLANFSANRLFYLARPERFELPTTWFVARYSIQLSYGR
jgi:hypothetical protein